MIADREHRREQVQVVADQTLDRLATHQVRDEGTHVAALGDVAGVAEAMHQLRPRASGASGVPTELGRLAREPVARQGRQHQVECIAGGATVRGRVGQRTDGLEQLDDRAGPAMRHDQRQRVLMPGPDVDEVDLHPVDLGRELRQRVQSRLALAPVVLGRPVEGELPQRRQLHALRPILDELLGGPARGSNAHAKLIKLGLGCMERERPNRVIFGRLASRGCVGYDGAFGIENGHGLSVVGRTKASCENGSRHMAVPCL